MAKKILVVDTSEWTGCNGCPCHFESGFHKQYCMAARERLVRRDRIQDYCPLKELPKPIDYEHRGGAVTEDYANGFNDCLTLIIGTED